MGYGIKIRVSGPYALFTRPEFKVERVSYDVITPSAARGLIEAIYWKPAIRWVIDKIHVLNEIRFANILRNEVGAAVSTTAVKQAMAMDDHAPIYLSATANRQQRTSLLLRDVDYVIEAHFDMTQKAEPGEERKHYNMALRRLRNGQHFHAPCLGTREFAAKVVLLEDADPMPVSALGSDGKRDLGWMLYDLDYGVRDDDQPREIRPNFFRARMINGVLDLTKVGGMVNP